MAPVAGQDFAAPQLTREEKLVYNLKVGKGSALFYLLEATRLASAVEDDLYRASNQIKQVDKTFARSKGKPDNRYFEATTTKIDLVFEKAKALRAEVEDCRLDLSDAIKETLVESAVQSDAPPEEKDSKKKPKDDKNKSSLNTQPKSQYAWP